METRENHSVAIAVVAGVVMLLLGLCLGALAGGLGGYLIGKQSAVASTGPRAVITVPARPFVTPIPRLQPPAIPLPGVTPGVQSRIDGIRVEEVVAGSPAEAAGILPGDVLTALDSTRLTTTTKLADLIARHSPGDTIRLELVRDGQSRGVTVELGARADDGTVAYLGVRYNEYQQSPTPAP